MSKFVDSCKAFLKDEEGLTVIEYVIGAAMLVFGLSTIFTGISGELSTKLTTIVQAIKSSS
ncbi:Flp family type IVb pilin [Vibrio rotiferianus]|uniref:Flp family type IVb pilin n=1 Tax=Vibrio rotiferianus TaxID=190895 RepID=A0A7Y3Z622_9VIBR|nr:Flp family type IVb pilin [Vibrio rotiferianus]NOH47159.1 Flp family type IVb pilin [Vibrio rotiferianus]